MSSGPASNQRNACEAGQSAGSASPGRIKLPPSAVCVKPAWTFRGCLRPACCPPCRDRTRPRRHRFPGPFRPRRPACRGQSAVDIGEQILLVDRTQPEQKFWLFVQPRADAVQHRRNVLAHRRVVRAAAGEADFRRLGKQAVVLTADAAPSRPWKTAPAAAPPGSRSRPRNPRRSTATALAAPASMLTVTL